MIDYVLFEKYAKNLDVLFVDDDESIKKESQELLSDLFNVAQVASDGLEGLTNYKNFYKEKNKYFDIVITDVVMPNINGVEFTKKIYEINPDQTIIVISAYSDSSDLIEFINIGVSHFLSKPIDVNRYISTLYYTSKHIYESNYLLSTSSNSTKDDFSWNGDAKILHYKNRVVNLTKKETLLIELLSTCSNKVFTNDEIINYIWEDSTDDKNYVSLKNLISRLKKKLPNLPITNSYGLGYKIDFNL